MRRNGRGRECLWITKSVLIKSKLIKACCYVTSTKVKGRRSKEKTGGEGSGIELEFLLVGGRDEGSKFSWLHFKMSLDQWYFTTLSPRLFGQGVHIFNLILFCH